jgi:hypothetical protein
LSVALILNIGLAWVLGLKRSMGGFLSRLFLSSLLTVGGAIMVFGAIVSRALLWHSFEH